MTKAATQALDESSRRYYLDAMGIQCWELIDAQRNGASASEGGGREVAAGSAPTAAAIQACTECGLHKTRKQAIAGRGNQAAELMFVVLSPSDNDDRNGLICSGEADALFSKMLAAIDVDIDDVYITSLLKCRVPVNHTVSPAEIQSCGGHLKQQIEFIRPELIVVLGETAACCLLQKEQTINESRALNSDGAQQLASVPLFFSYSPEELLQQPANKRKAWQDLQQLQKKIGNSSS